MRKYGILFLTIASLASFHKPQQAEEWLLEREKKGIKVFTRKSRWGKLKDSKATMLVPATADEMVELIWNVENYPNWVPRCKSARVLAHISADEFIMHVKFNVMWPIPDRDCVIRVKKVVDSKTGAITIHEISEPKYLREQEGVVRIQQMTAYWKFVPQNNGTIVTNEYSSNPGGNIPDWMTNTQSVENPFVTFENIQTVITSKK